MKKLSSVFVMLAALLVVAGPAWAGAAKVTIDPGRVQWDAQADYERAILTVSMPDGQVVRQEFSGRETPVFDLAAGAKDGAYTYELRLVARIDASLRKALAEARKSGDEAEIAKLRAQLPESPVVSGGFVVEAGSIVMPEGKEPQGPKSAKSAGSIGKITAADQVIPDDLIVQGSFCVGFDCVNNESFGFDTIRLKENNTRIKFEDTSTGSFPTNDWQLTANDSASGGASKFSIEDITGAKVPFTITAGASTNSIFVDSTGRVGFRTSTPVLDLHVATSNTPAIRLEQNNSGGFTAQTWDIAGNEANFFVRDVTGGSRLPFRIRPGAPTSSIDISAAGDVGLGTASPDRKLDIECNVSGGNGCVSVTNTSATGFSSIEFADESDNITANFGRDNTNDTFRLNSIGGNPIVILTNSTERIRFPAPGTDFIQATNGAELTAGGVWQDNSSRDSKLDVNELSDDAAREALRELTPVTFRYKAEPEEQYVGFIAEDLPDLVATNDRKHMNATDVVAVLTKVVQDQQKTIEGLNARLAELEKQKN